MKKTLLSVFLTVVIFSVALAQNNVVISEIYYNDSGSPDTLEFLEFYNPSNNPLSLAGFTVTDGIVDTLPNVVVASKGYYVICKDSIAFFQTFGISAHKWISGSLDNAGETIVVSRPDGSTSDSVTYGDSSPWDTLADGYGPSLVVCPDNLSEDNSRASNWTIENKGASNINLFTRYGLQVIASPGRANCPVIISVDNIKQNYSIYPNPATEFVHIEGLSDESTIYLYSVNGTMIHSTQYTSALDVRMIPSGVYILKIVSKDNSHTIRINKQ